MTSSQSGSDFPDYARAVWQVFCERRGSDFPLISPAEYGLIEKWYKQGIKARWVAYALRMTKGNGRNLFYYAPAVLEEAKHGFKSMLGAAQ